MITDDQMSWKIRHKQRDLPIYVTYYDYFFRVIYAIYFIHPLNTKGEWARPWVANEPWKLVNLSGEKASDSVASVPVYQDRCMNILDLVCYLYTTYTWNSLTANYW